MARILDARLPSDEGLAEAVALLVLVFRGEPLRAWRITDHQGTRWDFYPRPMI